VRSRHERVVRFCQAFLLISCFLACWCCPTLSSALEVSWSRNSEGNIAGYKLYYGVVSGNYQASKVVGNANVADISGLLPGQRYYFAVTAYDFLGRESQFSNEITTEISGNPEDYDEGLDLIDSDGDGVSDGQELVDGTNPNDKGSAVSVLGTKVCSEWNGFLDGMWNILELVNLGSRELAVQSTIYNLAGQTVSSRNVRVGVGRQVDVLVHEDSGRENNSYGLICLTHDGFAGDLDGRMVYYKGIAQPQTEEFQFAFALPFSNGKKGVQYATFNTYQPSLAAVDSRNIIANWIQITNLGSQRTDGELVFYDFTGTQLSRQRLVIDARQRIDIAGHQIGANKVGLVEWKPSVDTVPFQFRNVRYFYDNPYGVNSFDTAFQLEGSYGSGEELVVQLDRASETSVLEISNVLSQSVSALVKIYSQSGSQLWSLNVDLPAKSSRHIIVDEILPAGTKASATIKANQASSVIAVAMQYGRKSNGGLSYLYGLQAAPAIGYVKRGSYNTFLNQENNLVLTNASNTVDTVFISLSRPDNNVSGVSMWSIPAYGQVIVRLNDYDSANNYGVVTIQSSGANRTNATILRKRFSEYLIPTTAR
jgi:hypothetical protein